jgi:biotin carboxyl carrier protein
MKVRILVDGQPVELFNGEVSVEPVEPGVFSVLVDGRSFEVCLDGGTAWVGSRPFALEVHDPRELDDQAEGGGPAGRRDVVAPMPGKVIRLLAAEGDEVAAGQGLVVVEAMKMQNEMPSPKGGRVVSIGVKAGDAVATGQVLASVE